MPYRYMGFMGQQHVLIRITVKMFKDLKTRGFCVPHCYGDQVSLVAWCHGVPGLFPWGSVFIFLLQRLQVTGQDQVSDRDKNTCKTQPGNTLRTLGIFPRILELHQGTLEFI